MKRYNNKTYRINDIDFTRNPNHTFGRKGAEITFAEYFSTTYKVNLTSFEQPLIISAIKRKGFEDMAVALPPELCYLTGLYTFFLSLTFNYIFCLKNYCC
jgi:aubergine